MFSMPICCGLFYRSTLAIGFARLVVGFKSVACCMTRVYGRSLTFEKVMCIKLAPNKVGVSSTEWKQCVYSIELSVAHSLVFRLFAGLVLVSPIFLLVSICMSRVVVLSSFYFEYSGLDLKVLRVV